MIKIIYNFYKIIIINFKLEIKNIFIFFYNKILNSKNYIDIKIFKNMNKELKIFFNYFLNKKFKNVIYTKTIYKQTI